MRWTLVLLATLATACFGTSPSDGSTDKVGSQGSETGGSPTTTTTTMTTTTTTTTVPVSQNGRFDHVIWIVMENTDYSGAIANSVYKSFADSGIQFDSMKAEGHPSQPNYVAMIAGDKLGVSSDSNVDLSQTHLGDLLEKKGMDWRVYAENYPGSCFLGATSGRYARKHVPFLSFTNVSRVPQRCAKIVDFSGFQSDWANHRLPAFTMVVPNLDDDGHDHGSNLPADQSGAWFQKTFGPGLQDPRLMDRTLVIVTFDESENYFGSNKIYTAMYSPNLPGKVHVKATHSHYSLLKFIEDEWKLGDLGRNDKTAPVIAEIKGN